MVNMEMKHGVKRSCSGQWESRKEADACIVYTRATYFKFVTKYVHIYTIDRVLDKYIEGKGDMGLGHLLDIRVIKI